MVRVGFDVDGVLANFGGAFLERANHVLFPKKFDVTYTPKTWEWKEILTAKEFGQVWTSAMHETDWWLYDIPPLEGLDDAARYYYSHHDRDAEVWFISSRSNCKGRPAILQTELWLMNHMHLDHSPRVIIVHHANGKRELVEALELDYFIDDYAPTVMQLADVTNAYLLERTWNETDRGLYKIPSVPSVKAYIDIINRERHHGNGGDQAKVRELAVRAEKGTAAIPHVVREGLSHGLVGIV